MNEETLKQKMIDDLHRIKLTIAGATLAMSSKCDNLKDGIDAYLKDGKQKPPLLPEDYQQMFKYLMNIESMMRHFSEHLKPKYMGVSLQLGVIHGIEDGGDD